MFKEPVGLSGPKFISEDVSRSKVKTEGTNFSLQCQAQSHPTPRFTETREAYIFTTPTLKCPLKEIQEVPNFNS
ncbi:hypothetical protein Pmani_016874 [Petrolisthes manimaculis]|uniref:Ig-like domain-containing protein n=1 Tax=Petrolisthes manimaculis TaxID=1843537 RepID=A0AAE1PQS5_9EUCA|nr:hypothetical protein Pmani_016874 [Petrolisthes manimaculis]